MAFATLFVMPLFFSTNIIFGRAIIDEVEPFTLACIRWALTALILLPFAIATLRKESFNIAQLKSRIFLMGFLGMWICGALVYLALKYTSAANGILIYTSSPVLVILIERIFRGRTINLREIFGIALALFGVAIIIFKGHWKNVLQLNFNIGDLIFVLTAFSWAIYSVMLKSSRFDSLQTLPLFTLVAAAGAVLLLPFAAVETIWLGHFPTSILAWSCIAGIVILASIIAFSAYQNGVRIVGASTASVFLYLLPVYGVSLAVIFLGEILHAYHVWGIAIVLGGVILATLPTGLFGRRRLS